MGDPVDPHESFGLHSYNGHKFRVRLSPHVEGVEASFTKGKEPEEFVVTYKASSKKIDVVANKVYQTTLKTVSTAKAQAAAAVQAAKKNSAAAAIALQQKKQIKNSASLVDTITDATNYCAALRGPEFAACVASNIVDDFHRLTDAKGQLTKFRDSMSGRIRNYTCSDPNMQTTAPLYSYEHRLQGGTIPVKVDVLLNKTHSKIWKIDQFISDAECEVLMKHGKPRLRRATVAAEDGSSIVSENRKANQAVYDLHRLHPESDPLWCVLCLLCTMLVFV
jgi:hypothetical protein